MIQAYIPLTYGKLYLHVTEENSQLLPTPETSKKDIYGSVTSPLPGPNPPGLSLETSLNKAKRSAEIHELSRRVASVVLFLFQDWHSARTIYFNQNLDVRVYQFSDLSWKRELVPGTCPFRRVEILANYAPDRLIYGLQTTKFSETFPSLKHLLIREREAVGST